jgi:hypothetical protein
MIKDKSGSYHRVCMDCKKSKREIKAAARQQIQRRETRERRAKPKVRLVKKYTSPSGRVFWQYERTDTGRRVDIIMRDDRQARWNYTQAEATAEAKRRLGV